jgi:phage terminase large subunit
MLTQTTAQEKIARLRKRVRVVRGGTSASKTFSIIPLLIDYAIATPKSEISIVAETIPQLRRGALRDFLKIMDLIGMYDDSRFNKSSLVYTFSNGSYIEFFSADMSAKLRGARRDVLFVNECNNVEWEAYYQMAIRTRKFIYLDYNPVAEFWVDTELIKDSDTDFVVLTYKDNEALDKSIVQEIEKARDKAEHSEYWANWWRVYGLGEIGQVQGTIFTNWHQIDNVPQEAKYIGIGLDFGYSNDPTAIVMVYKWNNEFILDEIAYQKELSNKAIADILKPYGGLVVCDSAEPKSIADLRSYGINATPCVKGKDSIINGIQKIQALDRIHITKRSTNLIKEFRGYVWKTDRNGVALNEPIDFLNHCFVGNTKITTINGDVNIEDIKEGDLVLTSKGYKKVLKKFDNGIKDVNNYSMQFDTFSLSLCSTKEHKIKVNKEWKKISQLQEKDKLFLHKPLMAKPTSYTKTKDILVEVLKGYIPMFGYTIKGKYQKDTMFTMLMAILKIIQLTTLILFMEVCIYVTRVKKGLKTILSLLKTFMQRVLRQRKNGISQKRVESGIVNMVKIHGLIESIEPLIVNIVTKSLKQDIAEYQSTAITTAKLMHVEKGLKSKKQVYDIMVEDCHEYFANGVLVHNCIDASRYILSHVIVSPNYGKYHLR